MSGFASTRQLVAMRACVKKMLPDLGVNGRTGARFPVDLEPGTRQRHMPGASNTTRMRQWVITAPYNADIERYDIIFVPTLADPRSSIQTGPGYWVYQLEQPVSFNTEVTANCWQVYEDDGLQLDPVTDNCTVHLIRGGSQIGGARRGRFMPATPGSMHPMGEWLPDSLWVDYTQTDWRIGDVAEITALDFVGDLPHPHRWRCKNPRYVSEPPSYIQIELEGLAGGYEAP